MSDDLPMKYKTETRLVIIRDSGRSRPYAKRNIEVAIRDGEAALLKPSVAAVRIEQRVISKWAPVVESEPDA